MHGSFADAEGTLAGAHASDGAQRMKYHQIATTSQFINSMQTSGHGEQALHGGRGDEDRGESDHMPGEKALDSWTAGWNHPSHDVMS